MLESESDILVEGLQEMAAVRACRGLAEPQEQVGLTFLAYLFVFLFLKTLLLGSMYIWSLLNQLNRS